MSLFEVDVIDQLAGVAAGSSLDQARRARPDARANSQKSFVTLFSPAGPSGVSTLERYAIAAFVAGLQGEPTTGAFYRRGLSEAGAPKSWLDAVDAEVASSATLGPYGRFPDGPLSSEDREGLVYEPTAESRNVLGRRLAAGFAHAHLLVFRPRDASPEALRSLEEAGWSTTDIVTLSQLVAFLSFQIRVVAGLRLLAAKR